MSKKISIPSTQNETSLTEAVDVLKILSNPHRLSILCHIGEDVLSVTELMALVGLSQSSLSQHLSRLKQAGLVSIRREHNKIFYSLNSEEVGTIIALLRELYCKDKF